MATVYRVLEEDMGGGVWRLTLASPDRRNALDEETAAAWGDLVARRAADPAARALVVAAQGDDFCSGGDLRTLGAWASAARAGDDVQARIVTFYRSFGALLTVDLPVVAAVQGRAIGAGAALPLLCDAVVVGRSTSMQFNFSRLGLHPGMGSTTTLAARVGHREAVRLLCTGDPVAAVEAVGMGLATTVVDDAVVAEEAVRMARTLVDQGPVTRGIRAAVMAEVAASFETFVRREAAEQAQVFGSDEFAALLGAANRQVGAS